MSDRLSLAIVSPSVHKHGGTELCVAEQIERWKHSFDIRLYTMATDGVDLDGVYVRRIFKPRLPHLLVFIWWFVANSLARRRDARTLGAPDITYSAGVNALDADAVSVHIIFGRLIEVLSATRPPGRVSMRALHRAIYWRFVRVLERRAIRRADLVWTASHAHAADVGKRFNRDVETIAVVPHGVDSSSFSPDYRLDQRRNAREDLGLDDRYCILLVGNDIATKGVDLAVLALSFLKDDVTLLIVGDVDSAVVHAQAESAGVEQRVRVQPRTSDLRAAYGAADMLIAPSREDAFGLPAAEAYSMGLPVVVSTAAGVAEVISGYPNVIAIDDPTPEALASAVNALRGSVKLEQPRPRLPSWDEVANATSDLLRLVPTRRAAK